MNIVEIPKSKIHDTYSHQHHHTKDETFAVSSLQSYIHRVSQEECARLREGVPYVKVYRYNPKHLCPKLNVYGDVAREF